MFVNIYSKVSTSCSSIFVSIKKKDTEKNVTLLNSSFFRALASLSSISVRSNNIVVYYFKFKLRFVVLVCSRTNIASHGEPEKRKGKRTKTEKK